MDGTERGGERMRKNEMKLEFDSRSCNEGFARVAVAAFLTQLNPTLEEVADVKTAVSEAVTNSIVHGYENRKTEIIEITAKCEKNSVEILIVDHGVGIPDVKRAMEPFFTTKPNEERSGMGFTIMQTFMDEVAVDSKDGETRVKLLKRFKGNDNV